MTANTRKNTLYRSNKKIVPIVPSHDVPPVDLLSLYFPSSKSSARTRWRLGSVELGNGTCERRVVIAVSCCKLRINWVVGKPPNLLQETIHASEAAEVTVVTECSSAVSENSSERARWSGKHPCHQQWPDQGSIISMRTRGNELQGVCDRRD